MDAIRDMYDLLAPERGAELRQRNRERLAELEAQGAERRARLARVAATRRSRRGPSSAVSAR
jgi:hypothetical protein